MINHKSAIQQILDDNNGIITTSQVTEAGIPRHYLSTMVELGIVYRAERGIYILPEIWEDKLYFLQYRLSKGIFSHETALYLHQMTDRTPIRYTMTFPFGYNTGSAKKKDIITKLSMKKYYDLGIIEMDSPNNNPIKVYNIERTLCDIVKTKHKADVQVVNYAMKFYANSKSKHISKLLEYSEIFDVKSKMTNFMEILL